MPIFTLEELSDFNMRQLKQLAKYFNVNLENGLITKRRLIEQIYSKIEAEEDAELPKASLRVQRIRKSKGELK